MIVHSQPYVAVHDLTFEHQIAMTKLIRQAKLDHLADLATQGLDDDALAEAIAGRVLDAGVTLELLATALVPEGEAWSPALAERTRLTFAALTSRADQDALQAALAGLLYSFFLRGRALSRISRSYSDPGPPAAARPIGAASTSASGARSSANSPAGTPSALP